MENANCNRIGLAKTDYSGKPSTLCKGCGHDSITAAMIQAYYELGVPPSEVIKVSGIGCSSKTPTYFMDRGHGFNSVHGRMPAVATGAKVANRKLWTIGISGDGDTASIGMGQYCHIVRRNVDMIYVIENNGTYGLTKGQFSATADTGSKAKKGWSNPYPTIDVCAVAIELGAGFVARSFSGDRKQMIQLIKAAHSHKGIAVLDIISPCVTFNNQDNAHYSYAWGKDHEEPLHDITYIAPRNEIVLERELAEGEVREVAMHDGSVIILKNLEKGYDPTNRFEALRALEEAQRNNWLTTGLIYVSTDKPALAETHTLVDTPLNRLTDADLRPAREMIDKVNALMF